jgi:glucose dehydrogenase
LTAINAEDGQTITSFGDNGRVDLRIALYRKAQNPLQTSNPGRIFENLMIVSLPAQGAQYDATPADVQAYDVRTGKIAWVFHSIPHAGEYGYDTWPPEHYKIGGGGHNWSEFTVDEENGIAFIPFGTGRFDFYGGDRKGDNLFANSLVALDARTGRRLWHFQTIHHDLWDYDLPQAPKLLTIRQSGRNIDIVAQASKQGFLYVFERKTGRPIWPIEERPVPKSDIPGEWTSPTQPFPTKPAPFARQSFTEKDINPYLPAAERETLVQRFRTLRNEGLFTPPSFEGSIQLPGHNGGANFGGSAVDPARGATHRAARSGWPRRRTGWRAGGPDRHTRAEGQDDGGSERARRQGPGSGAVRIAVRVHEQQQPLHVRDRAAVVRDHGVRPEHGRHQVAGSRGRGECTARARHPGQHGIALPAQWTARHCGRPALPLDGIGSKIPRLRSRDGQGSVVARFASGLGRNARDL